MSDVNAALRYLRKLNNLTQREVADGIGVENRVYCYYEQDRFPRNPEVLKRLSEFYHVPISQLIDDDNELPIEFAIMAHKMERMSNEDKRRLFKTFDAAIEIFLEKYEDTDCN